jgi:hypothetical protein
MVVRISCNIDAPPGRNQDLISGTEGDIAVFDQLLRHVRIRDGPLDRGAVRIVGGLAIKMSLADDFARISLVDDRVMAPRALCDTERADKEKTNDEATRTKHWILLVISIRMLRCRSLAPEKLKRYAKRSTHQ